jgi:phosphoribosylglycinamide formyltransferase 2
MQVAHGFEVINMLDGEALDRIVAKHKPDVPEMKPFVLNVLRLRKQGITVVPSAKRQFHNEPKSHP